MTTTKNYNSNNMNLTFTENYNLDKIKFLFNLSFKSFDEYFNLERDSEKHIKYSVQDKKNYHNQISKFLNELLINSNDDNNICSVIKKYKITSGRCYVKGFGIQKFQREVRDFILYNEGSYDLDIINAIPSILLYFCDLHSINTPQLKIYVENRDNILSEYGLSKHDIIINLNQDIPKTKNNFMKLLNDDFLKVKNFIKNNKDFNKYNSNDDSLNPLSSKLSKILYEYETEIIQKVINILSKDNINALTFDGFIYNGLNIDEVLININSIVSEYKYIKFIVKKFQPFNTVLDELENFIEGGAECKHYSTKKIEFEKRFNYCTEFGTYLEKVDGEWKDRNIEQFKMNCATIRHNEIDSNGKLKEVDTFSVWKKDSKRLVFDNIVFEPYNIYDNLQKEAFEKKYENKRIINKFTGFDAKKIDLTEDNLKKSQIFWDYLYTTISYKNKDIFEHLKKFLAHIVQKPAELAEVINVFKSLEGAGKDTLILILTKILGEKYIYSTEDQSEIFGNFNEVMENKLIVVFNEAEGKAGNSNKEKIKGLSTKKKSTIKKKFMNATILDNYIRIFFFSNNANPVSLSSDSRRFCIINNNYAQIGDKEYFNNIYNNVINNDDIINTIFTELLDVDLSNWSPRFNKPVTSEEVKMKQHSYNLLHYWLFTILDKFENNGFVNYKNNYIIQSTNLLNNFIRYLKDEGFDKNTIIKNYKNTKRISNELLNDKLEGVTIKSVNQNGKSRKYYHFDMELFIPKIKMVFKNHKVESSDDLEFENFINNMSNENLIIDDTDSDTDSDSD